MREGPVNEQLRYALRTWAANLPHRTVWIVGYRPTWLRDVEHIPTIQTGTKYQNSTSAVRAACEHSDVSERFLLMNDDFFVMRRQTIMPTLHRGPVREVERYYAARASGQYLSGMRETRDLLVGLGYDDPMSYELHVPLPVEKAGMAEALDAGRYLAVVHKRTLYATLAHPLGRPLMKLVSQQSQHSNSKSSCAKDDAAESRLRLDYGRTRQVVATAALTCRTGPIWRSP
ncbi:hypothetical protein OG493_37850 [Streptomyces sp. NBC_01285]|nr:hypothetical protein [Streptomyces sp. NBC_01285]